jgi:hypothetical protein
MLSSTIQHILAQSDTNDNDTGRSREAAVKIYQNHDFEIKMQYPSNWTKQEDNLIADVNIVPYARYILAYV